jgi:hypothetical protein
VPSAKQSDFSKVSKQKLSPIKEAILKLGHLPNEWVSKGCGGAKKS